MIQTCLWESFGCYLACGEAFRDAGERSVLLQSLAEDMQGFTNAGL